MLDAIRKRRSVRFYRDEPVTDEQIAEVLEAGFCAPSAHAGRPWHVVVVREQAAKDTFASIHRWSKFIARVPVVLVVCVDRRKDDHFWHEDASAFLENVMIQASEMGLGTCWVGIRGLTEPGTDAEQIVRDALGLPDYFGVSAMASVGVPARYPGPHEPELPEGRVHFETYKET